MAPDLPPRRTPAYSRPMRRVVVMPFGLVIGLASPATALQDDLTDGPLPASEYVSTQWTVDDGLPTNNVTGMVRDGAGYLWVSTLQGLVRFDGVRFTPFPAVEWGLPSDRIRSVVRGPDDELWLVSDQNLLARLEDGEVTVFDGDRGLPDRTVRTIRVGAGREIEAVTNHGFFRLGGDRFERVPGEIEDTVAAVVEAPGGGLWLGTAGMGVHELRGERARSVEGFSGSPPRIHALWRDTDGTLWIGTDRGLLRRSADGEVVPVERTVS